MPASSTSNAAPRIRRSARTPQSAGCVESFSYGSLGRTKRLIMAALRVWELKNGIQDHAWERGESGHAEW